jgi:FMN phosphatase YigB (HAD superfamily)
MTGERAEDRGEPRSGGEPRSVGRPLRGIDAITFDFGNTLVDVTHDALVRVVERTATAVVERSGPFERARFLRAWTDELWRQFAEEVPAGREVDVDVGSSGV